MNKLSFILIFGLFSCQQLKPDTVRVPEYPDYENLMNTQVTLLANRKVRKTVTLGGDSEVKVLKLDSVKWTKELAFLKEINPNQPEYIGAFVKSGDASNQTLTLAAGENGALRSTSYAKSEAGFERISAVFHEDKDVYIHHRDIQLAFDDGVLHSVLIDGYQKMMFKDTIRFKIEIEVN